MGEVLDEIAALVLAEVLQDIVQPVAGQVVLEEGLHGEHAGLAEGEVAAEPGRLPLAGAPDAGLRWRAGFAGVAGLPLAGREDVCRESGSVIGKRESFG